MGKIDTLTKRYMSDSKVFADAFNFYLYGGEQVLLPENLHPMDTTAIGVPFGNKGKGKPLQKYRDVMKYAAAMEDGAAAYLVMGIENQANLHYAMPPRNQLYDALEYTRQVEKIAARYREENAKKLLDSGEYLSGFRKEDKLIPVVTLVIYFGAEAWDAPRSLHEMLDVKDERVLAYVSDYKLNLLVPAELSEADFDKFRTDLREVMRYIQYSADKEKLPALLENDRRFSEMSRDTAMLLNECTNSGLKIKESGGRVDMCKAIKEMRQEVYQEGHEVGRQEGREKSIRQSLDALMKNLGLSREQAMDALEIPEKERPVYQNE